MSIKKLLTIILGLMALHSFGVGLGMIILPTDWIAYFGIVPSSHRFFITQGGVFHIVMAFAYGIAASNIKSNSLLIRYSILVKFCATIFLFSYFLFVNPFLLVFFSGIVDFGMGIALLFTYNKYNSKVVK
jgi:hypothetical protein